MNFILKDGVDVDLSDNFENILIIELISRNPPRRVSYRISFAEHTSNQARHCPVAGGKIEC